MYGKASGGQSTGKHIPIELEIVDDEQRTLIFHMVPLWVHRNGVSAYREGMIR